MDVTVRRASADIARLEVFRADAESLAPAQQYLIAELIMMRLFSIIEGAVEDLACKLVAGSPYANGTHPTRMFSAKSVGSAKSAMLGHGRAKTKTYLRWTSVKDIRDSTSQVLNPSDPFIVNAQVHGNILTEMRKVRNFLAHKSARARQDYRDVVRAVYGANSRIRVQAFLTSRRRRPVAKVDEYLATARVMISDLAKG